MKELLFILEIVLGDGSHNTGQTEQCNQVGDGHHTVEGVGDVPHQLSRAGGTYDTDQNENNLVKNIYNFIAVGEVVKALLAIEAPTEDGRQCKENPVI